MPKQPIKGERAGNAYLETVARMEPDVTPIDAAAFYASAAISLKRIADSLDEIARVMPLLVNNRGTGGSGWAG